MKRPRRPPPLRNLAGLRWTAAEEAILREAFTSGGPVEPVIEALCVAGFIRTPHAIRAKAFALGLTKTYRRGKGAALLEARAQIRDLRHQIRELETEIRQLRTRRTV